MPRTMKLRLTKKQIEDKIKKYREQGEDELADELEQAIKDKNYISEHSSKFDSYLNEKNMSKSDLEKAIKASDSSKTSTTIKSEVDNFYSDILSDISGFKKIMSRAKSKPNLPEVQLFVVSFEKLKEALDIEEED